MVTSRLCTRGRRNPVPQSIRSEGTGRPPRAKYGGGRATIRTVCHIACHTHIGTAGPSSGTTIPDPPRNNSESLSRWPSPLTGGQLSSLTGSGVSGLEGCRVLLPSIGIPSIVQCLHYNSPDLAGSRNSWLWSFWLLI